MTAVGTELRETRRLAIIDLLGSPRAYWLMLALYLVAHFAFRLWETPNIGKNEVQAAVSAQVWAWGYHPRNPPLHTWLTMAAYAVFGVGLMAHVVLKHVLLGAVYAFAYLSGCRLLSTRTLAALSALSLTLLGPLAWTVHTAFTHTLLTLAVIFVTLWTAVRLSAARSFLNYAMFGVAVALGLLSKYSFILFLAPLLAAMLSQRTLCGALLNWRLLISLGVAAILIAPHVAWMLTAQFDFVEFLDSKQRSAIANPYWMDLSVGIGSIAIGALTFLTPFIFIVAVVFRKSMSTEYAAPSAWARALALVSVLGLGLLVLDSAVLRATQFELRYFTCALATTPLAVFLWLDRRPHDELQLRALVLSIAAVVVIAFVGLTGRALLYHDSCRRCWDEISYTSLIRGVHDAGFSHGTIIAPDEYVAANMRLAFPDARVTAVRYYVPQPPTAADGKCLLVWNTRINPGGDAAPSTLIDYFARIHAAPAQGEPRYVDALLRRSTERMDRFAYWLVPNADGNCHQR